VQRALNSIDQRPDSSIEQAVKRLEDVRDDKSRGIFKKNEFYYPELSRINDCAYFDYQQSRVYFRTNANIKKRMAISRKPAGITYKANSIINIAPVLYCPYCGQKKPRKYGNYSTWVYDLKMMTGGIKRWVIRCEYKRYSCKVCRRSFMSERSSAAPHKYGRTLVAWTVNQNIARMQTYRVITDEMREIFGYRFRGNLPFLFKQQKAQEYLPAYVGLMRDLVNGSYLHVDETDANIMGCRGYIWVFANAITAVYTFQPTREGAFLKECLGAFKGVLISDFYAAYDSLECPQQKCLIHLIRDINDSLFKYPFDAELQEIGKGFTQILAPIIDTIDKYGLNCKHLHKHKEPVDRFLKKVEKSAYTSEQSANLARRIEKYREKLFTFLDYDGVAWNNNNAEHAIKRFVQLRKVIGGSSTEKGIQEYLVLLSICETLRLRNMSFLRFLISGAKSIEEYELQQKKVA
jgi:transposase-like protein